MSTAKIQKWGNSQGIRLPKIMLEQADIKPDSEVMLIVQDDCIIIKKAAKHKRKSISEWFEGFEGETVCKEYDWGETVGEEIL